MKHLSLILACALPFAAAGGALAEKYLAAEKAASAWEGVLVVRNGTLVPNPSALTPQELAQSQLIDRDDFLIGMGCESQEGDAVMVETHEDHFPMCREIIRISALRDQTAARLRVASR